MAKRMKVGNFSGGGVEIDMTPMIDMTFQLIAFFMVLINFNEAEQNDKVQLPGSVLAKPPEGALEFPITLHVTPTGRVVLAGQEMAVEELPVYLTRETNELERQGKAAKDGTVIVRADKNCATGKVQKVIEVCQKARLEKFALRVKGESSK